MKKIIVTLLFALVLLNQLSLFPILSTGVICAEEQMGAAVAEKININTASAEELGSLKGIGDKTAQAIIEYRTQNGPFKQVEDIKNVKGIGDAKFEAIKNLISIE